MDSKRIGDSKTPLYSLLSIKGEGYAQQPLSIKGDGYSPWALTNGLVVHSTALPKE